MITKKVLNPHFYIFSDDTKWGERNLRLDHPTTYVKNNNDEKCYEDLHLMTLCKHHIIANSSFSWWAAWLSTNPRKIVIAPQKWFNNATRNTKDLIPQAWTLI